MSQDFDDIDDFLADKTSAGGAAYLGKWKDAGHVDVLHHCKAPIAVGLWRHRGLVVEDGENWQTREKENKVVSKNLGCLEDATVLKVQYKRDRDTGERITPPVKCGQCKFVEWIRTRVMTGDLDWLEPVFQLQGKDDERPTIVRAGHIYNGFGGANDKYDEDEIKAMAKAKVERKKAWMLNHYAKAYYVFRVLDVAHPEKGVQISVEPALLGDKVKAVIAGMREKYGTDEGNPLKTPYVIRWVYNKDADEFGKTYAAKEMVEGKNLVKVADSLKRLIQWEDPAEEQHASNAPDISGFTRKFNPVSWAALVRPHALIDVPWDELYGTEAPEYEGTEFDPAKLEGPKGRPTQLLGPKNEVLKEVPQAQEEMVACDKCDKPMPGSATKCPHCGKEYEVEEEPKAAPPPPPMKTRSQLIAEKKAQLIGAKGVPTSRGVAAPKLHHEKPSDDTEDDLPF